ncbi:MAG: hypothetical protein ACFFBD_27105 [Candidatus Hodarchaeota archaeon]
MRNIINHPIRERIIKILGKETLGFENLFRSTQLDDRGKFGYHLRKLIEGEIVLKHKDDSLYSLTVNGFQAYRTLIAESFTQSSKEAKYSVDIKDIKCPFCHEQELKLEIVDNFLALRCKICEPPLLLGSVFPKSWLSLKLPPTSLINLTALHVETQTHIVRNGICPLCFSPARHSWIWRDKIIPFHYYECTECGFSTENTLLEDIKAHWEFQKFIQLYHGELTFIDFFNVLKKFELCKKTKTVQIIFETNNKELKIDVRFEKGKIRLRSL